jgi:hypothetical protein
MYRHGKKRKRNGGELKSIDQIASLAVQNEENTRDGEFLVKSLACLAHKSSEDLCARQADCQTCYFSQTGTVRLLFNASASVCMMR